MNKLTQDFFRPFSAEKIAELMTLALEMEAYGVTASDVVTMAKAYFADITAKEEAYHTVNKKHRPGKIPRQKSTTCPSCGKSSLVAAINSDGLRIVGCKSCRYSKIINS